MPIERTPWTELRVIREKDGHTLTSLSNVVKAQGISLSYLSDLEKGRREPNVRVVKVLAVALNVPVSVLEKARRIESEQVAS